MKDALQRYLSVNVAQELIASGGTIAPRSAEATIMFTDIEGFTSLSETLTPRETAELLNGYFTLLNALIHREGGTVNNFVGDAVVAIFNVPAALPDHAFAAVRAAQAIQQALQKHRFALDDGRSVALPTRIGINTGPVYAGTVGSSDRQGYTVYGDAVNLAARIEPLNKHFGSRILVSEATRMAALSQGCAEPFHAMQLFSVAGRSEPVMLHAVDARA